MFFCMGNIYRKDIKGIFKYFNSLEALSKNDIKTLF